MAANKTCCRRARRRPSARPALTSGSRSRSAGRGSRPGRSTRHNGSFGVRRTSRRAALSRRAAQAGANQRRARTMRRAQCPANCSATDDDHQSRLRSADTTVIFRLYPVAIS
ncbi:hypothetical protein EVAR_27833_1 [Eumeta japonica]|uniref:Uncharacterized protein n=1 Tax=Eumeta variegata TaxID=151549 RepID=A0A4C1VI70_EUMVA|nr:hypothetical protein EVAR_27833_1 [Eumeta japonica]